MNKRLQTQVEDLLSDYKAIKEMLDAGFLNDRIREEVKFLNDYREQHDIFDHRFLDDNSEIGNHDYAALSIEAFSVNTQIEALLV